MASVYRRPNSPFWWAAFNYYGADGRLIRKARSTKCETHNDAMNCALAWQNAARDARKGALTVEKARGVLARLLEEFSGDSLAVMTIRQHFEGWLANKTASIAKKTRERYHVVTRDFLRFLGQRAGLGIAHLRRADIVGFRDAERKKGKSSRTVNLTVKIIGSVLRDAQGQSLRTDNPAATVERIESSDEAARLPFEAREIEAMLRAAPSVDWRGMILLGLYTGGRRH